MAKVKIQGNASGTGVLTVTAPNTSTDRTITLPDSTGTILDNTSTLDATKLSGNLPAISAASLTNVPKDTTVGGRKNLIINGGMDVWQRGTSTALTNGKSYVTDRFWMNPQSNASTHSRQAVTSPIAGMRSQYCLRIQRNSGGSSTGLMYFSTDLESSNAFACRGRKLTLSFYARKGANYSATSDLFQLGIVSGKGTDQTLVSGYTSGAFVANESNTLTSSWQRFTVTTGSVIADDITQIGLQDTRSSVGTAGANDYLEITGIQVEISDVATDFEYRSYGEELALCQRYFHQQGRQGSDRYEAFLNVAAFATTEARGSYPLPTSMRAFPTVSADGDFQTITGLDIQTISLADGGGNPSVGLNFAVASGFGVRDAYTIRSDNDADSYIQFDAEL